MRKEQTYRVEAVRLEEVHVPIDIVHVEAARRAIVRLRAKPVDAFDREGLAVGVEQAVMAVKLEEGGGGGER